MNIIKKHLRKITGTYDGKTLIKDVVWCTEDDLLNGNVDPAFIINGTDCINMSPEKVFPILEKAGMKKGENIVIPEGSKVLESPTRYGYEFTFKLPNSTFVIIDLENLDGYV